VPLRWPTTTAVAGSMIGEIGALDGGLVPNARGLSTQYLGTCLPVGLCAVCGAGGGDAGGGDAGGEARKLSKPFRISGYPAILVK